MADLASNVTGVARQCFPYPVDFNSKGERSRVVKTVVNVLRKLRKIPQNTTFVIVLLL